MKSTGSGSWLTSTIISLPIAYARDAELRMGIAVPSTIIRGRTRLSFGGVGHLEKLPWIIGGTALIIRSVESLRGCALTQKPSRGNRYYRVRGIL